MKLLRRNIDKYMEGSIVLQPEENEDLWHCYNLISVGDSVRSVTVRKIQHSSKTGSVETERVKMTLTVEVVSINYDALESVIHIKGRNLTENEHVKAGAFHTLDIELNRDFTLSKPTWDSISLERLDVACDAKHQADLVMLVMMEGLSHLCLMTESMTVTRAKIQSSIPRKRAGSSNHEKAMEKFYEANFNAVVKHVDFSIVKCLVIGSPGFIKEEFFEYLITNAQRREVKSILENRNRIVLAHASSGHKSAIREIMQDPGIASRLTETKASLEVRTLNEFYKMLADDPTRAYYGPRQVFAANDAMAIDTLLISDKLFRSTNIARRKEYVALVEGVKGKGGKVVLFSSLHVTGEQLDQLSGIATILRYPMPDLEELDDDPADEEEQPAIEEEED
eukprot:TRINITY_DN1269_c0_g1_i4.p1 TRINITY_DN1269_c0_g1~~TRINITY_DN1269_c0_g1_i4.p1  ORF type:complete len:394 (+),score=98.42 TRINITY_DN1269_c0_g1_i4:77-1258(+)